jgi:hypothetical protein
MMAVFSKVAIGQVIDKRYNTYLTTSSPSTTSDDPETLDYSVTTKYDDSGYVTVSATYDDPSGITDQWCIKLVQFDNSGTIQTGRYFYPVPPLSHNIHPLKIITLSGNQGYLITGYHEHISTSCPMPFVVKLDISYNVLAQHVYQICGFFTDVDEIPGGGFIFSGAWSNNINFAADRNGAIMRTDVNFNPIYSRSIFKYNPMATIGDFDIIHDLVIVDSSRAYVTGGFTDTCVNTSSGSSWVPPGVSGHLLFGEMDLTTGNFNWTNNIINNIPSAGGANFIQTIGSRVIFNDNYIVVASNNGNPGSSFIIFFDRNTGMFVSGYNVENLTISINSGHLLTHIPFIQNIYFIDTNKVFYSGKQIAIEFNYNPLTHFEIPCSGELDVNGNIGNGRLYVTDQHYDGNLADITSYYYKYGDCTLEYFPFYAASNTIPQNGNTGEFVTISHDKNDNFKNKTWIFTNDNQVCVNYHLELIAEPIVPKPQLGVHNISSGNPDLLNILLLIETLDNVEYECDEDPD